MYLVRVVSWMRVLILPLITANVLPYQQLPALELQPTNLAGF
jgi:hypothetical protein